MKFQRLPVEVDPFRLVEQGRELVGKLPLSDFPRLGDLLFAEDGLENKTDQAAIDVTLVFDRGETGLPTINGIIKCELVMSCQRCLNAVETKLESELCVVLVTSDAQAETLQEGYDTWLVEDNRMFLQDFIEDEVLLALPIVVSHEQCEPVRELIEALPDDERKQATDSLSANDEEEADKENPFAVLKNLKLKQ